MKRFVTIVFIILPFWATGQTKDIIPLLEEYMELWAEQTDNTSDDNELQEIIHHYLENNIDINDTGTSALADLFFVEHRHIAAIRRHIKYNGYLKNESELYSIAGLDSNTAHLLMPFVMVKITDKTSNISLADILHGGKHNIILGAKTIVEPSRGYTDSIYLGDPFRLYFRYKFTFGNKILLSFTAEKDAGEHFFSQSNPQGFDHYSFSLLLNNIGVVEQLAVGNFYACFGQGLTMWSGSGINFSTDGNIHKHSPTLRTAGGFAESGYLQGVAAKLRISKTMALTTFVSHTQRDATNFQVLPNGNATFQSIYTSGYHRSASELEKKNRVGETLAGANIQYHSNALSVGLSTTYHHFDATLQPAEYIYNYNSLSGNSNFNLAMDMSYHYRNLLLFAETAWDCNASNATIVGLQLIASSHSHLSAYYRHYAVDYLNMYSSALGQQTVPHNEQGLCAILSTELPWGIKMVASADAYKLPWLKYGIYSPSAGTEYRIKLSKVIAKGTLLNIQYRYRNNSANTNNPTAHMVTTEEKQTQNLQLHLRYNASETFTFNSRVAFSKVHTPSEGDTTGFLIYQEIVYTPNSAPLSVAMRYTLFQADNYDARIYAYERDFLYEYSTVAFSGKGSRFYIMLGWDISPQATLSLRYSLTLYPDRTYIGSGYDRIEGNRRQEIKLQLRCKL